MKRHHLSTTHRRVTAAMLVSAVAIASAASVGHAQASGPEPFTPASPSAGLSCPPVFQSPAARKIADELAKRLEPQAATLGLKSAVTIIKGDLRSGLRRELPSTDYLASQGVIAELDMGTVALCFPRLSNLLAEMDRLGTDSSRFAAAQQRRKEQDAAQRSAAEAAQRQRQADAAVAAQEQADLHRQQEAVAAVERQSRAEEARRQREAEARQIEEREANEQARRAEVQRQRQAEAAAAAEKQADLHRQQEAVAAVERQSRAEEARRQHDAQARQDEEREANEQARRAEVKQQRQGDAAAETDRLAAERKAREAEQQQLDAKVKTAEDEQSKAKAGFFSQSVKVPPGPGNPQPGEQNVWADALEQLMTPPADGDQPSGELVGAYRDYIFIRRCFDSRAEFELVYVTPEELEAAKSQIKSIEDALVKQDPSIDKAEQWATANRLNEETQDNLIVRMDPGHQAVTNREYTEKGQAACRSPVVGLREHFEKLYPAARVIKKDF